MNPPVIAPRPSILGLIGNTPLLRLEGFDELAGRNVELYAKAEWQNPGGSVKDRAAARMIAEGERARRAHAWRHDSRRHVGQHRHRLRHARRGAGLQGAALRARRTSRANGCERCAPTAPTSCSPIRWRASDGAIREARRLARERPGVLLSRSVQQPGQLARALRHGTAREIWEQTGGRGHPLRRRPRHERHVRRHVARGCANANPRHSARMPLQPDSPLHAVEGLKHMATSIVPGIYDPSIADAGSAGLDGRRAGHDAPAGRGRMDCSPVFPAARRLPRRCGSPRGVRDAVVVTVFPDGGARYLSEPFWEEDGGMSAFRAARRRRTPDSRARRRRVSVRMLRRADRHPGGRRHRDHRGTPAGQHHRSKARAAGSGSARRTTWRPSAARASPARISSASITRIRIIPPSVAVRPRSRVAESQLRHPRRRRAARRASCARGVCARTAPLSKRRPGT